jgi:glutaredoxin
VAYVSPACIASAVILQYLESRKIPYKVRDIVADAGAMLELAEITGGRVSVPVVVLGTKVLQNPKWTTLAGALRTWKG